MRRLEGRLFPDRRETEGALIDAGDAMALMGASTADAVLSGLRQIDWAYPALFVYREADENRWSHLMLGLSLKPELGEG